MRGPGRQADLGNGPFVASLTDWTTIFEATSVRKPQVFIACRSTWPTTVTFAIFPADGVSSSESRRDFECAIALTLPVTPGPVKA